MKRYILIVVIVSMSAIMTAQLQEYRFSDRYRVVMSGVNTNWFVSSFGGMNVYSGDASRVNESVSERISGGGKISMGKWITPGFALRVSCTGYGMNRGGESAGYDGYYNDDTGYGAFGGDVMFDMMNLLGGYKYKRIYSLIPYVGMGMAMKTGDDKSADLCSGVGIMNRFRINNRIDLNLELSSSFVFANGEPDKMGADKYNGLYSVSVGITYNINPKKMKGIRDVKRSANVIIENNLQMLRKRVADMEASLKNEMMQKERLENMKMVDK